MKTIRKNLKLQGKRIRELKNLIDIGMNKDRKNVGKYQNEVAEAIKKFRYEHLAFCMIRGIPYEVMERTTRKDNVIDTQLLDKTITDMRDNLNQRKKEAVL